MDICIVTSYLVDKLAKIKGKKAFQKLIYLSKAVGVPVDGNYKMYYYGPYSEQVADALEHCVCSNILAKDESSYNYYAGKKQKEFLEKNKSDLDKIKERLDFVIEEFGDCDPMELEILSTTHFIFNNMKYLYNTTEKSKIIDEVTRIKYPKFNISEIENSYNKLLNIGLLS